MPINRIARLNVYRRSMSRWRSSASSVRRLAFAESRLAISDVLRKLKRATQFWGSAMVSVPTGGRKKKLKAKVAEMEAAADSMNPQAVAIINTSIRYANPTVVTFTGIAVCANAVRAATPPSDTTRRKAREATYFSPPVHIVDPIKIRRRSGLTVGITPPGGRSLGSLVSGMNPGGGVPHLPGKKEIAGREEDDRGPSKDYSFRTSGRARELGAQEDECAKQQHKRNAEPKTVGRFHASIMAARQ